MSRQNDGLDVGGTTDAYTDRAEGYGRGNRTNDGLDSANTTDAYSQGHSGNYRGNDGIDASGTSDAYGSNAGRNTAGAYRDNDGLDASGTSDAQYGSGQTRGGDPSYNDRTSGGLGFDDRIGDSARTGGAQRGGDQETSQHTSGGLGENDTYGDEADTGGADTGHDHNFGMGSGRTISQEQGGILPTEPGRVDAEKGEDREFENRHRDMDDPYPDNSKKDSTMGKLMQKAGSAFGNKNLEQKGEMKRQGAATS